MSMKLISADELLRTLCAPCEYRGDKCLGVECDVDVVCAIREARAIEAVPVRWIEGLILYGDREDHNAALMLYRKWKAEQEAEA